MLIDVNTCYPLVNYKYNYIYIWLLINQYYIWLSHNELYMVTIGYYSLVN